MDERAVTDFPGWLVFAETLVNHLTRQPILGPGQKLDLGDKLRPGLSEGAKGEPNQLVGGGGTFEGHPLLLAAGVDAKGVQSLPLLKKG